jgi:hypothetical protein
MMDVIALILIMTTCVQYCHLHFSDKRTDTWKVRYLFKVIDYDKVKILNQTCSEFQASSASIMTHKYVI